MCKSITTLRGCRPGHRPLLTGIGLATALLFVSGCSIFTGSYRDSDSVRASSGNVVIVMNEIQVNDAKYSGSSVNSLIPLVEVELNRLGYTIQQKSESTADTPLKTLAGNTLPRKGNDVILSSEQETFSIDGSLTHSKSGNLLEPRDSMIVILHVRKGTQKLIGTVTLIADDTELSSAKSLSGNAYRIAKQIDALLQPYQKPQDHQ